MPIFCEHYLPRHRRRVLHQHYTLNLALTMSSTMHAHPTPAAYGINTSSLCSHSLPAAGGRCLLTRTIKHTAHDGVVGSMSQVRHHTPPERLHHLLLPLPHTAHPPQLHHDCKLRCTGRLRFIASNVGHRPAVAAAPRRAQQRHGRHASTDAGLFPMVQ